MGSGLRSSARQVKLACKAELKLDLALSVLVWRDFVAAAAYLSCAWARYKGPALGLL